jgi:hypothetical protein
MGTRTEPSPTSDATAEAALLDRARAMHARLGQTFERLLQRLGLPRAEFEAQVRRLEREPASRRALDAARYGDREPRRGPTSPVPTPPALPRNPRALRV